MQLSLDASYVLKLEELLSLPHLVDYKQMGFSFRNAGLLIDESDSTVSCRVCRATNLFQLNTLACEKHRLFVAPIDIQIALYMLLLCNGINSLLANAVMDHVK